MKKRVLSLILALVMACAVAVPASAATSYYEANLRGMADYYFGIGDMDSYNEVMKDLEEYLANNTDQKDENTTPTTKPETSGTHTVTEIVPPKYDRVKDFSEGLAAVELGIDEQGLDGKWGFIDTTGKEVVPCQYSEVGNFSEGLAAVWLATDEEDEDGYTIYKWGFIDKTGKEIVPCKYDRVGDFSEGLAAVCTKTHSDEKWGFIDKTGKEVVPCKYDKVWGFSEGLAAAGVFDGDWKWGFIDKTGKEVIPCKYENNHYDGLQFCEGFAAVKLNDKWGFIDKTGKEVVPCKYDRAGDFSEGLAAVSVGRYPSPDKWGFIDKTGNEVVPCNYEAKIGVPKFCEGFVAVKLNDKWGFIDKTGKEVILGKCTSVKDFSEGLAAVHGDTGEKNQWGITIYKWGFIDKTGKEVVPCKYDAVQDFSEGLAAVRIGNYSDVKWGFIDTTGQEVVPCSLEYGHISPLIGGFAQILGKDGKYGFLAITSGSATTPDTYTAKATNDKLTVDGVSKAPTAYKINNANYFQLRDVAVLLNSTKAQFSVDYDNTAKAIKITTGQPYQPNGKEMKGAKATAEAIVGNNDVYINGIKTDFAVYKIGGSNFFQIRDLGKALGFNVDWAKDVGIIIDPNSPYSGK